MKEKALVLILALSFAAFHVYSELHPLVTPPEYITPLAFSNENPDLFYAKYFTNASKVIVFFGNKDNAEKFASFVQNNSVVVISYGTYADVLMKRGVLSKILELADYSDIAGLPIDDYWNPQRLEKEYEDLNFLLTNYSFPEPIKRYLLNRLRQREEDIDKIEKAKDFIQSHRGLEFYEIEVVNLPHNTEYPDLSFDLMIVTLVGIVLIALVVVEKNRKIKAIFLVSFLFLVVSVYELGVYEIEVSNHENLLNYIIKAPENPFNLTSYENLNGSVGISCYVGNLDEMESILTAVNSSTIGIEHSLKGAWLHLAFVDSHPQRFLNFKECNLGSYGYNCRRQPTREELRVIEKTKELLQKIPEDKRYLVEDALLSYNATIHSCSEELKFKGIPPGRYLVSLYIFPKSLSQPNLQLIIQMIVSAIAVLLLIPLFEGEKH